MPPAGRDLIRRVMHEKGVCFSFYEVAHAQRKYLFFIDRLELFIDFSIQMLLSVTN